MKKEVKNTSKNIRVRFAPSPTGPLHVGGARTALINYLFAKQQKGDFVLRIEDTDKERSKLEWIPEIIDELKWLGMEWQEGPDIGGKFGPYKQSQKTNIYKEYLEQLLNEKKVYFCTCTPEELEAKRQDQASRGLAPKYDGKCRDARHTTGVIRFKVENKKVKFTDLVRGDVEFDAGLLGDIVIAKNLETPLYHFVVVVDDFQMQISHVIRAEEHLSNTPRQILLQEALGFDQLVYAHLPLILNADRSKMAKRSGDVAVSDYHKKGYLPEAMINFMVLLGWNPGTEQEIFSLSELIKIFSIDKVQKAGAVFNTQKLDSINSYYIKEKPIKKLVELCKPYFNEGYNKLSEKTLEKIVELHKPRMKKLSDITEMTNFFFAEKLHYDKTILSWKKVGESETKQALQCSEKIISEIKKFTKENLEKVLFEACTEFNKEKNYPEKDKGYLLWPLRVALSGKEASAGPFEIADILGKEKTLQRIQEAIESL